MKKCIKILLTIFILSLLCACQGEVPSRLAPDYDADGVYSGFSDIPEDYTVEDAQADSLIVIDSSLDTDRESQAVGFEHWETFQAAVANGENAFLRVAHFVDGVGYYHDLYFCDGKYTMFESSPEYGITQNGPYTYLRKLEYEGDREFLQGHCYYVLTDSLELTYYDVEWRFVSSDLTSVTDIPFEWLGFTAYFE